MGLRSRFTEQFERQGLLLKGLTRLAEFTIDAVDLNRLSLRRLRDLRSRLSECEAHIIAGVRALSRIRMD